MGDTPDKDDQKQQADAMDAIAQATAIGFAVASRTMEMWFGAMSGFARASREMMEPQIGEKLRDALKSAAEPSPVRAEAPAADAKVVDLASRKPSGKAATPKVEQPLVAKRMPVAGEPPAAPDDLKRIAGIGPKLEQVLNGFGIWTYARIAGLEPEEIAWLDDALGLNGRIGNDGWLAQAAELGRAGIQNRDKAAG
ncbi:MAG: NADH-ubiquinone dehydrogenase [Rhizobiaceae bacterium]|nr:NADH-ubiquinone dehydrogenase [Rhizobiaceae bacterium]